MKNLSSLLFIITLFIFSCESIEDQKPDPEGTVTTNVTNATYYVIYKGPNLDGGPTCVLLQFNMDIPAGNIRFFTNVSYDCASEQTSYSWPNISNVEGGELSDIGMVNGLGNVTERPNSGYSIQGNLTPGHGYVIRWRKSYKYNTSSQPYFYSRFYVTEYITSTTGGILGVTIKYQGPF